MILINVSAIQRLTSTISSKTNISRYNYNRLWHGRCLSTFNNWTMLSLISCSIQLNKLSGIYGFISMDFQDPLAFISYIYSLFAIAAFAYGGYAIKSDSIVALRRYTIFYWADLVSNAVLTALFSIRWFVFTDHSLPESAEDQISEEEHEKSFAMEGAVSIAILVILWLVHVYFGFVLTSYYHSLKTRGMKAVPVSFDRTSGGFDDEYELDEEAESTFRGYKPVNTEDSRANKLN
ncbi:hypothetical protein INT44_005246 [Umbelopsis vinacea]|uniref:Uncharacterized protein n=1 Tax=Umbelopsis vinacea TaxID=44442 RepID=A0A8H7Q7P2_9FUNG|nr:hypothetical protein INT44_005246 [Umbelopsis vinacea]